MKNPTLSDAITILAKHDFRCDVCNRLPDESSLWVHTYDESFTVEVNCHGKTETRNAYNRRLWNRNEYPTDFDMHFFSKEAQEILAAKAQPTNPTDDESDYLEIVYMTQPQKDPA